MEKPKTKNKTERKMTLDNAMDPNEKELERICKYCTFIIKSKKDRPNNGVCRRYPEQIMKHLTDWCGEYKPSKREQTKLRMKLTSV